MLEYGSKLAEITDFVVMDDKGSCYTNTIDKGTTFTIKMRLHSMRIFRSRSWHIHLRIFSGTEITGTNTMFEKMHIEHSEAGDICTVTFTQNMNLQGGEYLLSFGCTGYKNGDFTVFHRLYDACNITVISTQNTVGLLWIK